MKGIFRRRPTPAMGIALLALFVALSGTAVALPGKNRVEKNDYKRGSIGTRAIANNSIRSSDIRNSNVLSRDIRNGSVTGDDVDEGTLGEVPSAKVGCPTGTAFLTGSCIETGARPASNYFDASEICGDAGRRLPTNSELRSARRQLTLVGEEVTSNVFHDGVTNRYMAISDLGGIDRETVTTVNAFRCVAPLTN